MRAGLLAIVVLASCRPPRAPADVATARSGMSIAVYRDGARGYALVDDRRWIEVTDGSLVLANLPASTPLAALVVEPLGDSRLVLGRCSRDAAQTAIRCAVAGPRGRHLVRVLSSSDAVSYGVHHEVAMRSAEAATVASRYTIQTPAWGGAAHVTLFEGVPGDARAPREVAAGEASLDGSATVIEVPAREVAARLVRIYRGDLAEDDVRDESLASAQAVWVYLDLALPVGGMPAGAVHVTFAPPGESARELDLAPETRPTRAPPTRVRLPLWIDPQLVGTRLRVTMGRGDADLQERYTFTVGNLGPVAREVQVEQALRAAKRHLVTRGTPKPVLEGDVARVTLTIAPQAQAQADFALAFFF